MGGRQKEEGTEQFPVAENSVSGCSRLKLSDWSLLSSGSVTHRKCRSGIFVSANGGAAFLRPDWLENNTSGAQLERNYEWRQEQEAGTRVGDCIVWLCFEQHIWERAHSLNTCVRSGRRETKEA